MGASGKPKLSAVDSPSARPSRTGLNNQAASVHRHHTPSISKQAPQPTKAVLPSKKPCIACKSCGCISKISELAAPSTTPTTTPASSRRSVCCTPRASTKVKNTAPVAPAKAAPVKPSWASHSSEAGDTPKSVSATHTPSDAPAALPSK